MALDHCTLTQAQSRVSTNYIYIYMCVCVCVRACVCDMPTVANYMETIPSSNPAIIFARTLVGINFASDKRFGLANRPAGAEWKYDRDRVRGKSRTPSSPPSMRLLSLAYPKKYFICCSLITLLHLCELKIRRSLTIMSFFIAVLRNTYGFVQRWPFHCISNHLIKCLGTVTKLITGKH
jgi:hypothetical protein